MEKVYIVEANSGSHDAYRSWIHAIYLTKEKAEESKNKLNAEWEFKRNIPPPFPVDEDDDLINTNLSDEDKTIYHKWWFIKFNAKEFNKAIVKEYELEKIYLR